MEYIKIVSPEKGTKSWAGGTAERGGISDQESIF